MTRPFVGITTWRRFIDTDLGTGRPAHSLGTEYSAPIEAAGAAVVLLPPTAGVDEVLDRLDGLVLSGGEAAEFDTKNPHWFGSAGKGPVEILSMFGRHGERIHIRARAKPAL